MYKFRNKVLPTHPRMQIMMLVEECSEWAELSYPANNMCFANDPIKFCISECAFEKYFSGFFLHIWSFCKYSAL